MGMQVHFNLSDVLRASTVSIYSTKADELPDFQGEVPGGFFNIIPNGSLPSDDCWADVVHRRELVNWLIDNRIPFSAS